MNNSSSRDRLIKLEDEEEEDSEYEKFIENIRRRKEKFNWVMEEFEKKQSQPKPSLKSKSNQQYVTNFEGKIIKVEKREKRDTSHEKPKIKPVFHIKEPLIEPVEEKRISIKQSQEEFDFLKIPPNIG